MSYLFGRTKALFLPLRLKGWSVKVARYLYVLAVAKGLSEAEINNLKDDLCEVFKTKEVTIVAPKEIKVFSELDPAQIEKDLLCLTAKHGRVELRAGSKLE